MEDKVNVSVYWKPTGEGIKYYAFIPSSVPEDATIRRENLTILGRYNVDFGGYDLIFMLCSHLTGRKTDDAIGEIEKIVNKE